MLKPRKNIVFFDNDDDNVIRINILYFLYDLVTAKGKGERHSASLGEPTLPIGQDLHHDTNTNTKCEYKYKFKYKYTHKYK